MGFLHSHLTWKFSHRWIILCAPRLWASGHATCGARPDPWTREGMSNSSTESARLPPSLGLENEVLRNSDRPARPISPLLPNPCEFPLTPHQLTPQVIEKGWEVEHMLEPRTMPELVQIPNGQILIANGGHWSGFAAMHTVQDPIGNSNADHPVLTPSIYSPDAPLGRRISNEAKNFTIDTRRLVHSAYLGHSCWLVLGSQTGLS